MRIVQAFLRLIVPLFFDLEVYGSEYIPPSGGVIIAGNHTGVIEVPLALYYLKRTDIIILIAEK